MPYKRALSSIATAAAIIFTPLAVNSQPKVDMDCILKPGQENSCTPLVACVGETGVYFTGRAFGWGESGTLSGTTNAGYKCKGTWMRRNFFGAGQANLTCSNGLQAVVFYTSVDPETGTVVGHGYTNDRQKISAWSGHKIRQFIVNSAGDVDAKLMCGLVEIPLS